MKSTEFHIVFDANKGAGSVEGEGQVNQLTVFQPVV